MTRTVSRIIKMGFVAAGLTFGVIACGGGVGGGSNNDQGLAVNLVGFFETGATSCTDGNRVTSVGVPFSTLGDDTGGDPGFGSVNVGVGVQNQLGGQAFDVQTTFIEYQVPGASVNPPSTTVSTNALLGPGAEDVQSSLPVDFTSLPNCVVITTPVLPPAVRTWISLNRQNLPEAPFEMLAFITSRGQATGGDVLDTNTRVLSMLITPDVQIPPTGPAGAPDDGIGGGGGAIT